MKITSYYLGKVLSDDIFSIKGSFILKKVTRLTILDFNKLKNN